MRWVVRQRAFGNQLEMVEASTMFLIAVMNVLTSRRLGTHRQHNFLDSCRRHLQTFQRDGGNLIIVCTNVAI